MAANDEKEKGLNRDDLSLLMNQYANTVELNTIVLEQLKRILEQQSNIIDKQQRVCDSIDSVTGKLNGCNTTIVQVEKDLIEKYMDGKSQCSKDHSNLAIRVYALYGFLGVVTISLIGLLVDLTGKLDLVEAIAKSMGVG